MAPPSKTPKLASSRCYPQATFVYGQITSHGVELKDLSVDRQLALYNELFRFARVAFTALVDRPPPDMLYGPSPWGALSHLVMKRTCNSARQHVHKSVVSTFLPDFC